MKAPDESGINKDFTEKSTEWIATAGKRCTDDFLHTEMWSIGTTLAGIAAENSGWYSHLQCRQSRSEENAGEVLPFCRSESAASQPLSS